MHAHSLVHIYTHTRAHYCTGNSVEGVSRGTVGVCEWGGQGPTDTTTVTHTHNHSCCRFIHELLGSLSQQLFQLRPLWILSFQCIKTIKSTTTCIASFTVFHPMLFPWLLPPLWAWEVGTRLQERNVRFEQICLAWVLEICCNLAVYLLRLWHLGSAWLPLDTWNL